MLFEDKLRHWVSRMTEGQKEGKMDGLNLMTTWTHVRATPQYDLYSLTEEGFRKNSIASACIIMIATSAPEAQLKIYKPTEHGLEEDPDHWFNELLHRPNPYTSYYEFWELVHIYLNTSGNCYVRLIRPDDSPTSPVVMMEILRPDCVAPVVDSQGYVRGYQYRLNGHAVNFQVHEIMHLKFPDPLNEAEGLSPLARCIRELGIDNAATDFTKTFFENAAIPYGILSTSQKLREDEAERYRTKWAEWFRGFRGKNRFKPAVLGQDLKYEQLALNFQEMEFEALRSMTETRICGAFGVDPVLLPSWVGIKHGGKYSNYSEARKHLWEETIIPSLRRIESKITSQLLVAEGRIAKFDLTTIQALQEDVSSKFERYSKTFQAGILKLNEARLPLGLDIDTRYGNQYVWQLQQGGAAPVEGKSADTPDVVNSDEFVNPNKA